VVVVVAVAEAAALPAEKGVEVAEPVAVGKVIEATPSKP
jgi:hypothetical protein